MIFICETLQSYHFTFELFTFSKTQLNITILGTFIMHILYSYSLRRNLTLLSLQLHKVLNIIKIYLPTLKLFIIYSVTCREKNYIKYYKRENEIILGRTFLLLVGNCELSASSSVPGASGSIV